MKNDIIIQQPENRLESKIAFLFFFVVFRILLEVAYINFVSPVFEYSGFTFDLHLIKYIESWIIFFILILVTPSVLRRTSDYLVVYLLAIFFTPLIVFYSLANASREHIYIVFFGVLLIYIFRSGRVFNIPLLSNGTAIAFSLLIIGVVGATFWMLVSGGLGFFNLDLTEVYKYREQSGDVINQGPMGYVNVWTTKIFGPMLLAWALFRKRIFFVFILIALHVLWFGISSHKSVLFYPLLVFFLWIWFDKTKALALLPMVLSFVVISVFIFYTLTGDLFLGSLIIRRSFFVPSLLTFEYYNFFSNNPFVYWSNSITSAFITYPYSIDTSRLIGVELGTDSYANNSFLSTGYMHAGVPGIIFYCVFVGLLFRLIDSLTKVGIPPWVGVSSIIVPAHSLLTSADLPTSLLTHGLGVSIGLLFLIRSSRTIHVNYSSKKIS